MTRHKRIRKSNACPHLVGNTGNIYCDSRLYPLKMNRKYKSFLEEAERDRKSKISQMVQAAKQHWQLCDLLVSLKQMNKNNCNSALIVELEQRKLSVKKKLIYLKSKTDVHIPEALNILTVDPDPFVTKEEEFEEKIKNDVLHLEGKKTFKNSWRGIVKSQIFVRADNLQVITVNIDLFSTGNSLLDMLTEELGEDVKIYSIIFGTKELDMNKTLFEQEIYHGTTVDLNIRLLGGKGKKSKKKQPQVKDTNNNSTVNVETVKEELVSNKDHENKTSQNVVAEMDETSSTTAVGKFGEVQNLEVIEHLMRLKDLSNDGITPTPELGKDVCVTGISAGTQPCFENVATLFIKDEPLGASNVFHKMKVVICVNKTSVNLQPYNVETLLKEIRTDVRVAVRGRVERLSNEDNDIHEPHCELIRFKLVVDSDNHSLVYIKSQRPQYARQHSQPCCIEGAGGVFAQWNLKVGDRIDKNLQRVFCESTVSDDEIMNYVVAFKNCYDGEILVGVDKNGVVTGRKFSEGEMAKWRENLSKEIGKILPVSNEGAAICDNLDEASHLVHNKKCFVCVLSLSESGKNEAASNYFTRIYVPQGEAGRVYFRKLSDVHAFIRKGAENKRITNYEELFSSLSSLGSRRKPREISDDDLNIEEKFKEAIGETGLQKEYEILEMVSEYENQENEIKMIFGCDPTQTIKNKYLKEYTCGFLNASGGTILFGVEEAEKSKCGHIVGILIPMEKRRELLKEAVSAFSKFYPPVSESQFRLIFHKVIVPPEFTVKDKQSDNDDGDKFVLLCGPPGEISTKWQKFVQNKLNDCLCRVVPVKDMEDSKDKIDKKDEKVGFCIVVQKQGDILSSEFMKNLNDFCKQNSKITQGSIEASDLKTRLKELCIIELKIFRSHYPIHLIKPIDTHVFDKQGKMIKLSIEKMMSKFKLGVDSRTTFEVDKFLDHVGNFTPSGNSYILISSPFELTSTERDLHGLVLPQWTLVIDFDQYPKKEGHLFHRFEELNNIHQIERPPFIKTPHDKELGLNPEHAICWLAARGYHEVHKTLSEEGHGSWNMSHRKPLYARLDAELTSYLKPNYLHILVLWDDGHQSLLKSLQTVLEDILSINGRRTAVTFVCSTREARFEIVENLVQPLQQEYWEIITADSVYVALPYVLSRNLSHKLPTPYQSEDDYQVPHKKEFRGKNQTFPDILRQKVRDNISSYLNVMYMKKEFRLDQRTLEGERRNFYSGSAISDVGLSKKFGIKREKMNELEDEFQVLSKDKKSHVSMLCLKVDRGAGSTTLCSQFLYEHHKEYPCAQLLKLGDKLLSCIRDINHATKLPLLLFVDDEISHPQEFLDFMKALVECRTINVILLLVDPAETSSKKATLPQATKFPRIKSIVDSSTLRTCPYKVIELRKVLTDREINDLTNHLTDIIKDKKSLEKLEKLTNKAQNDKSVRSFAHFGLTAFGRNFKGLKHFVEFRLDQANSKQKAILSFLSLIHIYTDSHLPASALACFLETSKTLNLEEEFQEDDVRELLSPPADKKDSRRISFLEVAEEILKQLTSTKYGNYDKDNYWQFIKDVSVDLAKHVLSVNIKTKSIDKLTRRLFVTSEYESKKFSALIRAMKDADLNIARDTLVELEKVFENSSSFQSHIRAHLAKYYMIVVRPKNFKEAMPLIEKAVKDQPDDSLLRHIHGDIIRLHVKDLKKKINKNFNMDTIVSFAIKSSESFGIVRRERPHDSHGYMSDAMLRITVMEAAEKKQGKKLTDEKIPHGQGDSVVDYLLEMLDGIRERGDRTITKEEEYQLSLIPRAHNFLYDGVIDDFERKEIWKENFRKCIGDVPNLKRLCDKIRQMKPIFHDFRDDNSVWLHEVLLSIQSLNNGFEIDDEELTPEQIEERIGEIEGCALGLKCPEPLMKFWIRYSRSQKNVPPLKDVKKRVKEWVVNAKKQNRTSYLAQFYNYVVNVLVALQDPEDREKREKVTKPQQIKKYQKDNIVVPLEWLNPKDGHHINSTDSLLHHDDLVKEHKGQSGREVIEGYLSKKGVKRWKGTVSDVQKSWIGTITFKRHFEVRFVPQSVMNGRPKQGQTVSFCLGFDRLGLSAWWVRGEERIEPLENVKAYSAHKDEEESSSDNVEDMNDEIANSTSFFDSSFLPQRDKSWDSHSGKRMQGVVFSTNAKRGFGHIRHPDVLGQLFFHASQLAKPVITLKGTINKLMVLEFKVEKQPERTRATDIHVVKAENILPSIAEFRKAVYTLFNEKDSSPSTGRRRKEPGVVAKSRTDTQARETGVVVRHSKDKTFGFIAPDKKSHGKDIFLHPRRLLEKGPLPDIGQRVQFTVVKTDKGLEANGVCALPEMPSLPKPAEQENLLPKPSPEIKQEPLQIPSVPKLVGQEHTSPKPTPKVKQEPLQISSVTKPAEKENSSPKPIPEIEQELLQIPSVQKPAEQEQTLPKPTPEIKQEPLKIPSLKPAELESSALKPAPELKQEPLQIPSKPKPAEQENSSPKPAPELKQEPLQIPSAKPVEQDNLAQKTKLGIKQKILLKQLVPRRAEQENLAQKPTQEINQEELQTLPIPTQAEQENSAPRSTQEIKPNIEQGTKESKGDTTEPSFLDEEKSKELETVSTCRGLDDVFMSDSNFDFLLPVDDFHDACSNENLSHTRHPVPDRFFELPSARALRNDSRKTSPRKARSNPPDFLPSFMQTSPKKPQVKKSKPQKEQTEKSGMPDRQISLRPVRDSFTAQPMSFESRAGVKSNTSNQKRKPNLRSTGTKERSNPVNKDSGAPNFYTEKPMASDEKPKWTQKDFAAVRVNSEKLSNFQTTGANEKPKWTVQAFTPHGVNSEKPGTSRQTTGTNARLKSTPKALTAPMVDPEKQMVRIIDEFLKSKNVSTTMKNIRDLKSTQSKAEAVVVEILKTTLQESEEKQKLAGDLLTRCSEDKIFTKSDITKGMESCIRNLSKSEMESDVVAVSLGKISARLIAENVLDLRIISEVMKEVDLLFLQCLKELKGQKGENWLLKLFENSQVDLMTTLPEQFKNEEKMMEILLQQGLIFLLPQLKVKTDLFKQIQKDPNALSLCQWIKYNFDVKFRSSPEFASILTTCVLKYVTMATSLALGVDRKQPPSKEIQNKEKLMLEKFKPLVKQFVDDDVPLQVSALYALQEFCYYNEFPKGLLLRMFIMLYDLDIIEEEAFISWKEDINEQHPGKGKALFQVNAWLTWLETATEESSESEPE